ncbi:MAG: ATP-grasp domain-containing protein, partial [Candidatus Sericytochromatia bacterium]|nr:ATP-grasp domain-containing protein [Candidatus Sericytochromatia bacterium]
AAEAGTVFQELLPFADAGTLQGLQGGLTTAADGALGQARTQVDHALSQRSQGQAAKAPEHSGAAIHWREAGRGVIDFAQDMTVGTFHQVVNDPLRFPTRMIAGMAISLHSAIKDSGGALVGLASAGAYGSFGAQMTQELANSATWVAGFAKPRRTNLHPEFAETQKVTKNGFARAMHCWDDIHKNPVTTQKLAKSLSLGEGMAKRLGNFESRVRDGKNKLWYGTEIIYQGEKQKRGEVRQGAVWKDQGWEPVKVEKGHTLGTENQKLYDALDNKWSEYELVHKADPSAMAKTVLAKDVIKELGLKIPTTKTGQAKFLTKFQAALDQKFPNGFFVKGVQDFNTGGNLPTNKSNFKTLYEGYHREFIPDAKKVNGEQSIMRAHPFHAGRMLDDLLRDPESVVIQERMNLKRYTKKELPIDVQPFQEFRVHVVRGQVVPGASSHRWGVMRTVLDRKDMHKAEAFTQALFDKLPAKAKKNMAFSPDIVKLEDGSFKLIELNVGGNSGFLHRNPLAANKMVEAVTGRETNGLYVARRLGYSAVASTVVATHQEHVRAQDEAGRHQTVSATVPAGKPAED